MELYFQIPSAKVQRSFTKKNVRQIRLASKSIRRKQVFPALHCCTLEAYGIRRLAIGSVHGLVQ